jgi:hypothetical protein
MADASRLARDADRWSAKRRRFQQRYAGGWIPRRKLRFDRVAFRPADAQAIFTPKSVNGSNDDTWCIDDAARRASASLHLHDGRCSRGRGVSQLI